MKTLIVGDVHGKVEVVERALAQESPVIFVGDILDSYDRSIPDHLRCLDLIFEAIDAGKAQCLYGNHELSYLIPRMRCSGYSWQMATHIDGGYREEMQKRFKYFLFYKPNVLIVHGGLDNRIWNKYNLSLSNLEQTLTEWVFDLDSPAYWIGYSRGGMHPSGGLFWCDFEREFVEVPELVQIVGHTRGRELRQKGNSYCIDYNDYGSDLFYWDLE